MDGTQGHAYPRLFSPVRVGAFTLPNRIMQSALSSVSTTDGSVTPRHLDLYRNRARGGVGLIVTEALAGHRRQQPGTRVRAHDERNFSGLQRWVDAVETVGCRLVGQFVDPGRGRHHPGRSAAAIGASALPDDLSWTVPHPLSVAEIASVIADFAETARRLQRAGFSGVELSCGHGHMFHQFLSPHANRRTDAYGGDLEGRTRLVRELAQAIRDLCGTRFILGLKLPGDDGVAGGIDPLEARAIAARLREAGFADYIAVAQGAHHRTLEMHVPDRTYPPAAYRALARGMKQVCGEIPVATVGRVTTPEDAEEVLRAGDCDLVMMGRALLADAGWVRKAAAGRGGDIQRCINCNTCWETITEGHPVVCDVNPLLGAPDELDWQPRPAQRRRRVVIVGAGPAGLAAAAIAAARGHEVILLGRSRDPGGKARLNARIPGCSQLDEIFALRARQAREAGAEFRLGAAATAADIRALAPDAVVLATGATMIRPDGLAGSDVADARAATAALLAGAAGGRCAVLYDCDHTAGTYDVAELLAERFANVVLVTPRELVAQDVALVVRQRVYRRLHARRVRLVLSSEITGFADRTVAVRNVWNGDAGEIADVDLLTWSAVRAPAVALADALAGEGIELHSIGDCRVPGGVLSAIAEGHAVGNRL